MRLCFGRMLEAGMRMAGGLGGGVPSVMNTIAGLTTAFGWVTTVQQMEPLECIYEHRAALH